MEDTELTINERVEELESKGWKYLHDGVQWSSGIWVHDELGCVNNGGGSFRWIGDAVVALEKFLKNIEACYS